MKGELACVAVALALASAGCGALPAALGPTTPCMGRVNEEFIEEITDVAAIERVDVSIEDDGEIAGFSLHHLDVESVPEAVRVLAQGQYPGSRLLHYGTSHEADLMTLYHVYLRTAEGVECDMAAEGGGELVHTECVVETSALPAPVRAAVDGIGAGEITEATHVEGAGIDVFVINKTIDNRTHVLEVTPRGEIVEHAVVVDAALLIPFLGNPLRSVDPDSVRAQHNSDSAIPAEEPEQPTEPPPSWDEFGN